MSVEQGLCCLCVCIRFYHSYSPLKCLFLSPLFLTSTDLPDEAQVDEGLPGDGDVVLAASVESPGVPEREATEMNHMDESCRGCGRGLDESNSRGQLVCGGRPGLGHSGVGMNNQKYDNN